MHILHSESDAVRFAPFLLIRICDTILISASALYYRPTRRPRLPVAVIQALCKADNDSMMTERSEVRVQSNGFRDFVPVILCVRTEYGSMYPVSTCHLASVYGCDISKTRCCVLNTHHS